MNQWPPTTATSDASVGFGHYDEWAGRNRGDTSPSLSMGHPVDACSITSLGYFKW